MFFNPRLQYDTCNVGFFDRKLITEDYSVQKTVIQYNGRFTLLPSVQHEIYKILYLKLSYFIFQSRY